MVNYKQAIEGLYPEQKRGELITNITNLCIKKRGNQGSEIKEYLSCLNPNDVTPFNTLLNGFIANVSGNNYSDVGDFEDIIAILASDYLYLYILKKYPGEKLYNEANIKTFPDTLKETIYIRSEFSGINEIKSLLKNLTLNLKSGETLQFQVCEITDDILVKNVGKSNFYNLMSFINSLKEGLDKDILKTVTLITKRLSTLYTNLYNSNAVILYNENSELCYESINEGNIFESCKGFETIRSYVSTVFSTWEEVTNIDCSLNKLYRGSSEYDLNEESDCLESLFESLEDNENVYMPFYHLRNLRLGLTEFTKICGNNSVFFNLVYDYLKNLDKSKYSMMADKLCKAFTNFLAITMVNGHTILLRGSYFIEEPITYTGRQHNAAQVWNDVNSKYYNVFQKNSKRMLSGSINDIFTVSTCLNTNSDFRDMTTITFTYNKTMYEHENLFAYKLYVGDNKITPNINSPVIGVKLDASLYRKNIFIKQFTNIMAGSRSGKGTLTMSLLVPLLCAKSSIVYLDNKPDIASLFWNLENRINQTWGENTLRFLAIDTDAQFAKDESGRPGRVDKSSRSVNPQNLLNVPDFITGILDESTLKLLRNLKFAQLLAFIGKSNELGIMQKSEWPQRKIYIFADEITKYIGDLNQKLYKKLSNEDYNTYADDKDVVKYMKKIVSVIQSTNEVANKIWFGTALNAGWNGFNLICVGQSLTLPSWGGQVSYLISSKLGNSESIKSTVYGQAVGAERNVLWLSGKQQARLSDYNLVEGSTEYKYLDGNTGLAGSFLVHEQKPKIIFNSSYSNISKYGMFEKGGNKTINDFDFIRTYFAVVDNDVTPEYVSEVKSLLDNSDIEGLRTYLEDQSKLGYTTMFMNNVAKSITAQDGVQLFVDCMEAALNDIYDFENDRPRKEIGFEGLLNLLLNNQGLDLDDTSNADMKELIESWNYPYDYLFDIVKGCFRDKYSTLEEYLYDVGLDSLLSINELARLYQRNKSRNKQRRAFNTYSGGSETPEGSEEKSESDSSSSSDSYEGGSGFSEEESSDGSGGSDAGGSSDGSEKGFDESPEDGFEDEEDEFERQEREERQKKEEKAERIYNGFMPEFNININKIKKQINNLNQITREEKNRGKFTTLQTNTLNDFNGLYLKDRASFFAKLEKDITADDEIKTIVIDKYTKLYDDTLNMLKSTIENMDFNVPVEESEDDEESGDFEGSDSSSGFEDTEEDSDDFSPPLTPPKPVPVPSPKPINQRNSTQGRQINTYIDTKGMQFNVHNLDSMGNVKASRQLTQMIIKDIKQQFGGVNNIEEITITANGCLYINGYGYMPQFPDDFVGSLGTALQYDLQDGRLSKIVNMGAVVSNIMDNVFSLTIEPPNIAYNHLFQMEIGANKGYDKLFKSYRNLQEIYLPDNELTRNNPQGNNAPPGIGSKLANLFGFGRGNTPNPASDYNGNSLVDRMFESAPVRVMTNALGWTLGCKAVVLAATMFGPFGLLFGGFAMYGAYKEIKNSNGNQGNYNNGGQRGRQNSGGGQRRQSSGGGRSGSGGKKSSKGSKKQNNRQQQSTLDDDWEEDW